MQGDRKKTFLEREILRWQSLARQIPCPPADLSLWRCGDKEPQWQAGRLQAGRVQTHTQSSPGPPLPALGFHTPLHTQQELPKPMCTH